MSELYFVHASDDSTAFLNVFKEHFEANFFVLEPTRQSAESAVEFLKSIPDDSLVIFLGHGSSVGLYTPEKSGFEKFLFVDKSNCEEIFKNKNVILLSCRSREFITKINSVTQIIGFGNILSSPAELAIEADIETGYRRNLSDEDINYFNTAYCTAIINALRSFKNGIGEFRNFPKIISFYINKNISEILLNKKVDNRVEIARLLFEFRNEMLFRMPQRGNHI